jgi:hypothetical protein
MSQSGASGTFEPVIRVSRLPPSDVTITVQPSGRPATDWVLPAGRIVWVIQS